METGVKKLTINKLDSSKSILDFLPKKEGFLFKLLLHLCVYIASGFGILGGRFFLINPARYFPDGIRQNLSKKNRAAPYQSQTNAPRTYP